MKKDNMKTKKPCKGNYRVDKFEGCDSVNYYSLKYGLCPACFYDWMQTTENGKIYYIKHFRKDIKKTTIKRKRKEWSIEKAKMIENIETKSEVEAKLQTLINRIVRLIDKGHPCISSNRKLGKSYDAGHYFGRQSNPTIRFHLMNIYAQSVQQNQHQGGNPIGMIENIGILFGESVKERVSALKKHPSIHLHKFELKEKMVIARRIIKWLLLQDKKFTIKERIELRDKYNLELGIYSTC